MPPGIAGRNFYFNLDNAAGSPQDLSTFVMSADINDDIGMEDDTTFSSTRTAKTAVITLTEGGFSVKGPFHATLNTHLKAVKMGLTAANGTLTFILGPQGSTTGQERITGECRMKALKRSGEVAGILQMEAEFQFDGTVTENTF